MGEDVRACQGAEAQLARVLVVPGLLMLCRQLFPSFAPLSLQNEHFEIYDNI